MTLSIDYPKDYTTNYASKILFDEAKILSKVIESWPDGDHEEALKDRKKKLQQLKSAMNEKA